MQKTLTIPTISCAHCLKTIERELTFVEGVRYVQGSIETRAVLVEYTDEQALAKARAVLAEAGYAPTN
ncbi:MAG: heavy-metal-associated domain-containing protein [Caldilineales bacterium]|nr:heavy-metal-associated domain-containing protein [Caldilineales bacterium]